MAPEKPNGLVEDQKGMMDIAVDFYKNLFTYERGSAKLDRTFCKEDEKVTKVENEEFVKPFSEVEVKEALFSSYAEGAPGPDGIFFLLTKSFGRQLKSDLINMFNDFHRGDLDQFSYAYPHS